MFNENYDPYAEASAANDAKYAKNIEGSEEEYTDIAKQNASVIIEKLTEVAGLYHSGILGQLEQAQLTSAGEDILNAIAKLELLKQSL